MNEKNFLGLSLRTDGYIACGSEENAVYVYYKAIATPMLALKFGEPDTSNGPSWSSADRCQYDDEAGTFVSSVCWKQGTDILMVANSMGNLRVLELE